MKMNTIIDELMNEISSKQLIPMNKPYQYIQDNLYKCKIVIEHILQQKYKDTMYCVDVSEYFNLIVIRMSNDNNNFNKDNEYIKLCKDFKELFIESGLYDINIALLSGNLTKNDYRISVLY